MNLRDQVESLLPNWQSWYPTVFDAAVDLGILRARVCPPGSLLLSQRHASIYNEAVQAFREQWSVVEQEEQSEISSREGDEEERGESDADRVMRLVSKLPPNTISVPRPAMFVAIVTAPGRPASATICASFSWNLAFNTW